jgi:hypothetical protein
MLKDMIYVSDTSRLVAIKGLGTFKLVDIKGLGTLRLVDTSGI